MNNARTIFEHVDGSVTSRPGLVPVEVGMTIYAGPNERLIVTEVELHIPSESVEVSESEQKTRLYVKVAAHPDPPRDPWIELH